MSSQNIDGIDLRTANIIGPKTIHNISAIRGQSDYNQNFFQVNSICQILSIKMRFNSKKSGRKVRKISKHICKSRPLSKSTRTKDQFIIINLLNCDYQGISIFFSRLNHKPSTQTKM